MIPFYANQLSGIASGRWDAEFPGPTYGKIDPNSEFGKHFLTEPIFEKQNTTGSSGSDDTFSDAEVGRKDLPFGVVPGFNLRGLGLDEDLAYGLRPDGTLTNVYSGGGDDKFNFTLADDLIKQGYVEGDRRQPGFEFGGKGYANPHYNSYSGTKAPNFLDDYAPGLALTAMANWVTGGWYGYAKGAGDLLDDGGSGKSRSEKGRIVGGMVVGGLGDYYGGGMEPDVSNSGMDFGGAGVGWDPNTLGLSSLASGFDPNSVSNSGMDFGGPNVGWRTDGPNIGPDGGMFDGWGDSMADFLRRGGSLDEWMKKYGISKGGPVSTLFNIGSGAYGLYEANRMRGAAEKAANRADPFVAQRADANARLMALSANPSSIFDTPGYKAGEQAVMRQKGSQGYTGSGNMAVALQQYGGSFYDKERAYLANLASASPGNAGTIQFEGDKARLDLIGRSLNNFGYAIGGR